MVAIYCTPQTLHYVLQPDWSLLFSVNIQCVLHCKQGSLYCPTIDSAVNSAPYCHCGSTEWLHFRFIATATSPV